MLLLPGPVSRSLPAHSTTLLADRLLEFVHCMGGAGVIVVLLGDPRVGVVQQGHAEPDMRGVLLAERGHCRVPEEVWRNGVTEGRARVLDDPAV